MYIPQCVYSIQTLPGHVPNLGLLTVHDTSITTAFNWFTHTHTIEHTHTHTTTYGFGNPGPGMLCHTHTHTHTLKPLNTHSHHDIWL